MQVNEFRFDVAYDSVYRFDKEADAFRYIGSFHKFRIDKDDSFPEAIDKVRSKLEEIEYCVNGI